MKVAGTWPGFVHKLPLVAIEAKSIRADTYNEMGCVHL